MVTRIRNIYTVLCLFVLFGISYYQSYAQSDLVLSQFDRTQNYYNPAFAGNRKECFLTIMHNRQWEGMPGASKSFVVMGDSPIKFLGKEIGVGILIVNDKIGLYTQSELSGQAVYRQKLFGGTLSIGAEFSLFNSTFDGTKVHLIDGEGQSIDDPAIPKTKIGGKTFDLKAGLLYSRSHWYIAMAARHIFKPMVKYDEHSYFTLLPSYNLMAGYNIEPNNSLFHWHPSLFASITDKHYRVDLRMGTSYNDKFFGSLMYRPNTAAGLSLGMNFGKVYIGYGFEMPINSLANRNYGTHELMLSYHFPIQKPKKGDVKHKSVRLL